MIAAFSACVRAINEVMLTRLSQACAHLVLKFTGSSMFTSLLTMRRTSTLAGRRFNTGRQTRQRPVLRRVQPLCMQRMTAAKEMTRAEDGPVRACDAALLRGLETL